MPHSILKSLGFHMQPEASVFNITFPCRTVWGSLHIWDLLPSSPCHLFILPTLQQVFLDPSYSWSIYRWGNPGLSQFFSPEGERGLGSYIVLKILFLQPHFPTHCPYIMCTMGVTLGDETISSGSNDWTGLRKQDWADYHWDRRSNGSC